MSTIFFTQSDGTKEVKSDSKWNSGKTSSKRRKSKDHNNGKSTLRPFTSQ